MPRHDIDDAGRRIERERFGRDPVTERILSERLTRHWQNLSVHPGRQPADEAHDRSD